MSASVPTNFKSWRRFHEICADSLNVFLAQPIEESIFDEENIFCTQDSFGSFADALELIQQAFSHSYPQLAQQIDTTFSETELITSDFHGDLEPPYFVGAEGSRPAIGIDFDGSARSMIDLAHEYGHALQFVASGKKQIPPMYREIFAFLGEFALFQFLLDHDDPRADELQHVILEDNQTYLLENFEDLRSASEDSTTIYKYEWNYPVARFLAQWINSFVPADKIEKLFLSGADLSRLLDFNEILNTSTSSNTLPHFALHDDGDRRLAYAHLGAIAVLETEVWDDELETTIGDFYSMAQSAMQQNRLVMSLDVAGRPNAYAILDGNERSAALLRKCSPFGTDKTLQNQLALRASTELEASRTVNGRNVQ